MRDFVTFVFILACVVAVTGFPIPPQIKTNMGISRWSNFRLLSTAEMEPEMNKLTPPQPPTTLPLTANSKGKGNYMPLYERIKSLMSGRGWNAKGFSAENLAKLGLNALLAYGFVSNVSYITCLIVSWIIYGKSTGLSPLAPNQWKPFFAVYAGLWAANNVLRPVRFTVSLALSPLFEKFIDFVQARTGFKRPTATGIVVFLVNVCGTCSYLFLGLLLAVAITGVPLR